MKKKTLKLFPLVDHFLSYVTFLVVTRETDEGKAMTNHNSRETLSKVVSRRRILSGTRDHINKASLFSKRDKMNKIFLSVIFTSRKNQSANLEYANTNEGV